MATELRNGEMSWIWLRFLFQIGSLSAKSHGTIS